MKRYLVGPHRLNGDRIEYEIRSIDGNFFDTLADFSKNELLREVQVGNAARYHECFEALDGIENPAAIKELILAVDELQVTPLKEAFERLHKSLLAIGKKE